MTQSRPHGSDRNAAMRATVQQLLAEYQQQMDRLGEARKRIAELSGQASSPDRVITVTVDASGVASKIEFTRDVFSEYTPVRLAETLTSVLRQAASQVRGQAAEIGESMRGNAPKLADLVPGAPNLPDLPTVPEVATPAAGQPAGHRSPRDDEDYDQGSFLEERPR
ncbi:YbaB/EbfC family nucleoid-associated protein [Goodfellowiella coeruleoviolacea]|uniref:YbaB/EbfC DNA-binding family protein n=1 Tax=Goodfellowiella coeruleoviolacea TaxID=334858 RepID=A0AAE3G962_9PSEU|nr:YbaB/EbfC family nucleoid-associated protein [Goodfellowiella coeruleoviolacea]MCP2163967.1 YbaB/EbfC DNA-binding family protein [Goodfellowiella coeruleoviolacea]